MRETGVIWLNISLDSLQPERFRAITRLVALDKILADSDAAMSAGFSQIKYGTARSNTATMAKALKPRGQDFDLRAQPIIVRHMDATGG